MSKDPLVLFMPSGKRGRFPIGTPVLEAARQLGVYVESVCGSRGICGRCQSRSGAGSRSWHYVIPLEHISILTQENAAEKRELKPGRRLCSAAYRATSSLMCRGHCDQCAARAQLRPTVIGATCRAIVLCRGDAADMHMPLRSRSIAAGAGTRMGLQDVAVCGTCPQVEDPGTAAGRSGGDPGRADSSTLIALWPDCCRTGIWHCLRYRLDDDALHLVSLLSGRVARPPARQIH